jgi:hypothetical protein
MQANEVRKRLLYLLLGKAGTEGQGNFDNLWGVYFLRPPIMLKIVPP